MRIYCARLDFETRCIKSKHDTRTKRAGITVYNKECEEYLNKYLASRTDEKDKRFVISWNQFSKMMWKKASKAADFKITAQILRKWQQQH